jgi:hypothetical protein
MRRLVILLTLALLTGMILPAQAQADIRLDWPPPVYFLQGTVTVTGSAAPPNLQSFFLEVAPWSNAPTGWIPVTLPARNPVTSGALGQWDTTLLEDGIYVLRLSVALTDGTRQYATSGPLRVGNQLEIPSGEPQPIAQAPIVAATDAPPAAPTMVPRPVVNNDLPLPVGGQVKFFEESTQAYMREAGMTWVKWQIPYVIGDSNLFNVARDRINWSHEAGFLVLLSIVGQKEAMAEIGEAEYFPQYAAFVGEIAAMGPDAIQVWNEQNLDREWPQGRIDPRSYTELLRQSYTAIKAADPQVQVITGAPAPTGAEGAFGLSRVWNDDRYYLGMANAGAADYADCIGVHYNEGIIPPVQQGGDPRQPDYPTRYLPLMMQRAAFPFRENPRPICFTELGYLSPEGFDSLPSGFAWAANTSVAEQSEWLAGAVTVAAQMSSVQVSLIIVFNMDFTTFTDDPQAGYAIIRPDGTCPACAALNALRG